MESNRNLKKWLIVSCIGLAAIVTAWFFINPSKPSNTYYNQTVTIDVDHLTYSSIEELEEDAQYVFIGRVKGEGTASTENSQPEDDNNDPTPFTEYQIEIEETFKGKFSTREVTLRQLGGIGNNTKYTVEGHPLLISGNSYVFFAIQGDGKYGALAGGYAIGIIEGNSFSLPSETGIDSAIELSQLSR